MPGNCHVDANCGVGGYCSPSYTGTGCGSLGGYYCHTPSDQCIDDTDCGSGGGLSVCTYDQSVGYWMCKMRGLCG